MDRKKRWCAAIASAALLMTTAAALVRTSAADQSVTSPAPSTAPATTPAGALMLGFAPIEYFQLHCARCHGPYGSFYGEGFGAHVAPGGLRNVVRDMAEGPAMAPLPDHQLDLLVAWHQSLIDKAPYVVIVESSGGGDEPLVIRGEVTPGASVTVTADGAPPLRATVTGHTWTITLPSATDPAALSVTAAINAKQSTTRPSSR
jgi:hypothetical protein